eukprot:TRINITY_DN358_c10_g1_i3.p3 TRINITY_DN358_c10_g1~~TRINITY_DN358_c10_g1_i3.p3  ORF type:complete len:116 (-),score=9.13 TRINITY_DN358_c10_g1_i3:129-476(-)
MTNAFHAPKGALFFFSFDQIKITKDLLLVYMTLLLGAVSPISFSCEDPFQKKKRKKETNTARNASAFIHLVQWKYNKNYGKEKKKKTTHEGEWECRSFFCFLFFLSSSRWGETKE